MEQQPQAQPKVAGEREGYLHFGERVEGKAAIDFKKYFARTNAEVGHLDFLKNPKNPREVVRRFDVTALEEVAPLDRDPKKLKSNQWPFKLVVDKKNYIVIAETEKELTEWVQSITEFKKYITTIVEGVDAKVAKGLTPIQKAQVASFHQRLFSTELNDTEKQWCDNACLVRYLKARMDKLGWSVDKSLLMIQETLKWRKEFKPDDIKEEDIKELIDAGVLYLNGKDKQGRPILVVKMNAPLQDYVKYTKYVVYILEKAISQMDPELTEQSIWILDLKGANRKVFPPKAVCKEAMNIFYTHYPERLYKLFIVDPPKVFSVFWAMIGTFLEPETKAKIALLSGPEGVGTKKTDALLEMIDEAVLETDYGGKNPSKDRGVIKEDDEEPDPTELEAKQDEEDKSA